MIAEPELCEVSVDADLLIFGCRTRAVHDVEDLVFLGDLLLDDRSDLIPVRREKLGGDCDGRSVHFVEEGAEALTVCHVGGFQARPVSRERGGISVCDAVIDADKLCGGNADLLAVEVRSDACIQLLHAPKVRDLMLCARGGSRAFRQLHGDAREKEGLHDEGGGLLVLLGHAVCDVDTGDILPLLNGDIVEADIVGCRKGASGNAGELCGVFSGESIGVLADNTDTGIYGVFDEWDKEAELYPVATADEVKKGKAQILSTVDSSEKQFYDIEILKINSDSPDNKNMVIQVTDSELISKTGGIVQGMSGSPIIQDGKVIGAVTHVLVNNPEKGYAIFAETMLDAG